MEFIWHILLTVCINDSCLEQDVQWFESKQSCETSLVMYKEIPVDGNWDTVKYECKPVGSIAS